MALLTLVIMVGGWSQALDKDSSLLHVALHTPHPDTFNSGLCMQKTSWDESEQLELGWETS